MIERFYRGCNPYWRNLRSTVPQNSEMQTEMNNQYTRRARPCILAGRLDVIPRWWLVMTAYSKRIAIFGLHSARSSDYSTWYPLQVSKGGGLVIQYRPQFNIESLGTNGYFH